MGNVKSIIKWANYFVQSANPYSNRTNFGSLSMRT
jgi:hypothetical protein